MLLALIFLATRATYAANELHRFDTCAEMNRAAARGENFWPKPVPFHLMNSRTPVEAVSKHGRAAITLGFDAEDAHAPLFLMTSSPPVRAQMASRLHPLTVDKAKEMVPDLEIQKEFLDDVGFTATRTTIPAEDLPDTYLAALASQALGRPSWVKGDHEEYQDFVVSGIQNLLDPTKQDFVVTLDIRTPEIQHPSYAATPLNLLTSLGKLQEKLKTEAKPHIHLGVAAHLFPTLEEKAGVMAPVEAMYFLARLRAEHNKESPEEKFIAGSPIAWRFKVRGPIQIEPGRWNEGKIDDYQLRMPGAKNIGMAMDFALHCLRNGDKIEMPNKPFGNKGPDGIFEQSLGNVTGNLRYLAWVYSLRKRPQQNAVARRLNELADEAAAELSQNATSRVIDDGSFLLVGKLSIQTKTKIFDVLDSSGVMSDEWIKYVLKP